MEELKKYLEAVIDKDFNYEVEHWDNGNYDDSYEYGIEVGEQQAYMEILEKLKEITKEK